MKVSLAKIPVSSLLRICLYSELSTVPKQSSPCVDRASQADEVDEEGRAFVRP